MNKFRNNLHSAFLIERFDGGYGSDPDKQKNSERRENNPEIELSRENKKIKEIISATKEFLEKQKDEVVENALNNYDFSKIVDAVVEKQRGDAEFETKKQIFQNRLDSEASQGQKYEDVWNQQVKEGFNFLITNLENDGEFFADCTNESQKNRKIAEVLGSYIISVEDQYKTYVWEADDDKFNAYKDKIFNVHNNMSPTNSILHNIRNQDNSKVTRTKLEANNVGKPKEKDPQTNSNEEKQEIEKINKRIKFLAHELPNYLWEIKDTNFFQKLFLQMDVPSDTDKKEITNFIKLVDKLDGENAEVKLIEIFNELEKGASDDAIKAKLSEKGLSLKKDSEISKIKESFNFYVDIMNRYNPVKNQHAIYLNIITIIKTEGGFDKAIAAYKDKVDNYKKNKRQEKKGKEYEKGKKLDKDEETKGLKAFADALNITVDTEDKKVKRQIDKTKHDYTRVTRLSNKDDEYFKNTDIVDILADINNDKEITAADRGTQKTGTQFKEVYKSVKRILGGDENAENKIIENLLNQAKIHNNTLPENVRISDGEFSKEQIQQGNKKLILLLQTIISEGGRDFYPLLMCGPEADKQQSALYKALELIPESSEDPKVQEAAKKSLEKIGITPETSFDDLQGVTYDSLCQATAGALHVAYLDAADGAIQAAKSSDAGNENYIKGAGIGTVISFDERVKGLSLNIGVQLGEGGGNNSKVIPGFGINLAYSPTVELQKGWSVTPNAHCGFIMLGPIPAGSVGGGVAFAKEWTNKHHVDRKVGGGIDSSYIRTGNTRVFSAQVGGSRDKLKGIENDKEKMGKTFNKEIITPLLDKIASNFEGKEFDLINPENCKLVDKAVDEMVKKVIGDMKDKKSDFDDKDIVKLKETTIRLLINYNKAPIDNKLVREYIAGEISECYASIWTEQNLNALNNQVYVSGLRAGVSAAWLVGSCFFAPVLHLGMSFKKHRNDGYGDGSIKKYEIDDPKIKGEKWTEEMIEAYNKYLEEDAPLEFILDEENCGYIKISQEAISKYNILLNPGMKGLMKKDDEGNVLLSAETYMSLPIIFRGVANKSTDILIGGGKRENAKRLDEIISDSTWFTEDDNILTDKLPGREYEFTIQDLTGTLEEIKTQVRSKNSEDPILKFNFDESILQGMEKGQKYKITLTKEKNGEIKQSDPEPVNDGDALQIEYIYEAESIPLMDKLAQDIAKHTYMQVQRVKSNALRNISHDKNNKLYPEYRNFAEKIGDKDYQEAKRIIMDLLPKMQDAINQFQGKNDQISFENVKKDIHSIEDDVALGQALLSINNIFARVTSVQGGGEEETYNFRKYKGKGEYAPTSMGNIIQERAGEIKRVINNATKKENDPLDVNTAASYTSLINAMEEYRKNDNTNYYKTTSQKTTTLQNAVGINLGNGINIENPLFNPEIYDDSKIALENLDFEGKDYLQQHAMEVMAKDKSLMGPILKRLNVPLPEGSNKIKYDFVDYNKNAGELIIKIEGKKVKFRAEMSVGYFSQCVNHMILLDNIEAELDGGSDSKTFNAPVAGNGLLEEGTVKSITATSQGHVNIAGSLGKQGKPPVEDSEPDDYDS